MISLQMRYCLVMALLCLSFTSLLGQLDSLERKEVQVAPDKKWYDTFSIRGYSQVRYNRLLETNENLGCEQCYRS